MWPKLFRISICFFAGLLSFASSFGQSYSTLRVKRIAANFDTLQIDTLSIQPSTFLIGGFAADTTQFKLDAARARLIRKSENKSSFASDSLSISYRVFPFYFKKEFAAKEKKLSTAEERGISNPFVYTPRKKDLTAQTYRGLNKTGSLSRGISLGNNQDLAVNSTLNLQLSGNISPEIEINAAITDDNIPIQPDGNTQQLQDFDKVYIQLSDTKSKLIVGDFQLTRPESYFLNFNKRLQGASFGTTQLVKLKSDSLGLKLKTGASIAVARGRFARNAIQGVEGNQGPYRLKGNSNEQYIVILSGSEKVYIDGRLLTRGQEFDYTIDYNNAEITFTARNLMTKDLRVFVEFEYSDRNYARSFVNLSNEAEFGKWRTRVHFFSEQDAKKQPLQQQLTDAQKFVLEQAGDSTDLALAEAIDSVAFSPELVLYKRIDTLVTGILYNGILVYSSNPDSAFYRAAFTSVGTNKGDYIQISSAVNGRVFQWVAPIGGVQQGNYVARAQLIPPTQKQILTTAADYRITKKLTLSTEAAFSNNDLNTFSLKDQLDDQGYAIRSALNHTTKIGRDTSPWELNSSLSLEHVNRNFSPQERFRTVEFDRDWNLQKLSTGKRDETIPRLSIKAEKPGLGQINYLFTAFSRSSEFDANQHVFSTDLRKRKVKLQFNSSLTNSDANASVARFYRHRSNISYGIWKMELGYKDELENNLLKLDTLQEGSYAFYDRQVFLQNRDTARQKFSLFYRIRDDEVLSQNRLKRSTRAESYGLSTELAKGEAMQLKTITTIRNLFIDDTLLSSLDPERTLINRVELGLRLFKGIVVANSFYEAGSGLETRKEFSYLEVQPGQGVYSWTDYNGNAIKELNEFELAAFADQARYIRVFIPTNDFIKVYSTQFSQTVNVKAPGAWTKEKGVRRFIARVSTQSAWKTDGKTTTEDLARAYNPVALGIDDTALIAFNRATRNTVFFNRGAAKFAMEFNWQSLSNKALLNNGIEARDNRFSNHRLRWNAGDILTITTETRNGQKRSEAVFFTNRNYRINYSELSPALTLQPNAAFRASLTYKYSIKQNSEEYGAERATSHTAGTEIKYNVAEKGSFQGRFNFILIQFSGTQNTPVAFEMQEGLKSGNNFTWGINYQRTLANNMQLNINYDGRKSPETKTIHIGGVQVRLFF
jgi:hypothetical protein